MLVWVWFVPQEFNLGLALHFTNLDAFEHIPLLLLGQCSKFRCHLFQFRNVVLSFQVRHIHEHLLSLNVQVKLTIIFKLFTGR